MVGSRLMNSTGLKIDTQASLVMCTRRLLSYHNQLATKLYENSPAHIYTYPFEPNPDWSAFYASGPEIKKYFENFSEKYDLAPAISLNSKVISAVWDEDEGIC